MAHFDFTYSIARPFPYRWFRWVTLFGGLCALVLFTALNLAADGYQLKLHTTKDINGTINQKRWTRAFPFNLLDKTPTTCQSLELSLNTKFWTTNLALPFTLVSAWQGSNDEFVYSTSLLYTNNPLQNCQIWYIQVNLDTLEMVGNELIAPWNATAVPVGTGNLPWSPRVSAFVNCTIVNSAAPLQVTLLAEYASLIAADKMPSFPTRSNKGRPPSFWWGQSLLSWYWSNLTITSGFPYTRGSLNLVPRDDSRSILDDDFFRVSGYWFRTMDDVQPATWDLYKPSLLVNHVHELNIGNQVDLLAKAMYATVLADLGQQSSGLEKNALSDSKLLANLSSPITGLASSARKHGSEWIEAGPANRSYDPVVDGLLTFGDAYIDAQYLCQVPTLKPWTSLFVSVLIANLVLLQAAWKLLCWGTSQWLDSSDPHAHYCIGCLKSAQIDGAPARSDDYSEIQSITTKRATAQESIPLITVRKVNTTTQNDD